MLAVVALSVAGLAVLFAVGPRVPMDPVVTFRDDTLPADMNAWVAQQESGYPDIRPGNAKQIVWADPATRARTPLAIVYVHGFSAGPGEIRPLPDLVADALGANLFLTRLTGHGRTGPAMLEGSVRAWADDMAEALAIGRRLGDRVVIIATSTGATLATWAATQPELMHDVAGLVQISPNYGVRAAGSQLLTLPWANWLVPLLAGPTRSFPTETALHAQHWTSTYPTLALLPMGALLKLTEAVDPGEITVPSLFVFSPHDQIVQPDLTRRIAARWGAPHQIIEVETSGDRNNHVIAGDALSPETTHSLSNQIIAWIRRL
ncbi:esterase/lipase [Hoeflea marina]|uniref:Esterase/lipase n=1 Tax=Hoeflea marina TaxID=274592 RepID=A0A317PS07_9HYPH|nr:esterase/lipase [Hoeflea marina]